MSSGPATPFLLQMAGEPGSGKSALARAVGRATGAVVVDKDVIKTAALRLGLVDSLAGQLSYEVFFDLADSLLAQGHSVVLDSPSFYESIPAKGQSTAARHGARYCFVECAGVGRADVARRLATRDGLASQPDRPIAPQWGTVAPGGPYLRVDTSRPVEHALELVLEYLR